VQHETETKSNIPNKTFLSPLITAMLKSPSLTENLEQNPKYSFKKLM